MSTGASACGSKASLGCRVATDHFLPVVPLLANSESSHRLISASTALRCCQRIGLSATGSVISPVPAVT
jgi:hypothetical protein